MFQGLLLSIDPLLWLLAEQCSLSRNLLNSVGASEDEAKPEIIGKTKFMNKCFAAPCGNSRYQTPSPHWRPESGNEIKTPDVNVSGCEVWLRCTQQQSSYLNSTKAMRLLETSNRFSLAVLQGGWRQSQLTLGEGGVYPHNLPVYHRYEMQRQMPIHTPTGNLESPGNLHVFGLWEEARVPRGNPCRHVENMQTPHRKAGFEPQVFLL